uniref:R3P n=1 Tax=Fusarium pseudograminearum mycovirus TaxID=2994965 RepID=A0A9E8M6S6_9VIRU|nr:R3P [Fusarium pseudograminearum mycovirus]
MSPSDSHSQAPHPADNLEDQFLKNAGLNSMDQIDPAQERASTTTEKVKTIRHTDVSAAPVPPKELAKSVADAKTGLPTEVASDILAPFIGIRVSYASKKRLSSYWPSSKMMFFIVHLINSRLVDHFYFKRYCPDFHPYIFRLYCGILFYIQSLRASADVKSLPDDQHQFMIRFLQAYPPESLPVPGPLLTLFKSLCSSQPEIQTYGKVYPRVPPSPGPAKRSEFWKANPVAFMQPNVPGIFALLSHLNSIINADQPNYPKKGKHTPVTATSTQGQIFGHHSFAPLATRSTSDKWACNSAGLEYPCEADSKLNEGFAERYENFDFPTTTDDDDLTHLQNFLGMNETLSWFAQVKDVAASISLYCNGSGTLADCSPFSISSNQLIIQYLTPSKDVPPPERSADPKSNFPFSFRMSTTARQLPELSEMIAAQCQTNVRVFKTHPFAGTFGDENHRQGPFWSIRPIESSDSDYESFLGLVEIVRQMIKSRV